MSWERAPLRLRSDRGGGEARDGCAAVGQQGDKAWRLRRKLGEPLGCGDPPGVLGSANGTFWNISKASRGLRHKPRTYGLTGLRGLMEKLQSLERAWWRTLGLMTGSEK